MKSHNAALEITTINLLDLIWQFQRKIKSVKATDFPINIAASPTNHPSPIPFAIITLVRCRKDIEFYLKIPLCVSNIQNIVLFRQHYTHTSICHVMQFIFQFLIKVIISCPAGGIVSLFKLGLSCPLLCCKGYHTDCQRFYTNSISSVWTVAISQCLIYLSCFTQFTWFVDRSGQWISLPFVW